LDCASKRGTMRKEFDVGIVFSKNDLWTILSDIREAMRKELEELLTDERFSPKA
jgi:hypothetical protein